MILSLHIFYLRGLLVPLFTLTRAAELWADFLESKSWNHTSSMIYFFARFKTSLQAVKFKRKRRQIKQQKLLIAHLLSDWLKLLLYYLVSHYIFRISNQPQTTHSNDHIWKSIISSNEIYNNEELLAHFCVTCGTFWRLLKDSPYLIGQSAQQ